MPDGTFWVSDEYGPFLMHFSSDGYCLEMRSPFNYGIPEVYACRRPNRGMEGLCANRSGTLLYGALQSPIADSVDYAPKNSVPLCAISLEGNDVREYAYPLDKGAEGVSALACLNDSTLLVLERDGRFPINGKALKRVYKVVLPDCIPNKPFLLSKELVADLMVGIPDYPHDKAEGLAVIGDSVIAVANDDDFGITADCDGKGTYVPKLCPNGKLDCNEVYFIPL